MRKITVKLQMAFILLLCSLTPVSYSYAANNAGAFLRNGIGARALGMGSAFVGITDTGAVSYWNPASLGFSEKLYLDTMYADKFKLGVEYGFIGAGMPTYLGGFGISYLQEGVKDIEKSTTLDVNNRPVISGTFNNLEQAVFVSYGKSINSKIALGTNFKYIYHTLDTSTASGIGADAGMLLKGSGTGVLNNLSMGMAVHDIANTQIKWNTGHIDTVPMTLKLGAAYRLDVKRFGCDNLIVAVDVNKRENRNTTINEGIEANFLNMLSLRAGLRDNDLSFGGSVSFMFLKIDYAFITHTLGDTQYFSIGGKF